MYTIQVNHCCSPIIYLYSTASIKDRGRDQVSFGILSAFRSTFTVIIGLNSIVKYLLIKIKIRYILRESSDMDVLIVSS